MPRRRYKYLPGAITLAIVGAFALVAIITAMYS
jgi:hypothetical protein